MKKYFTLLIIVAASNFATAQTQNIENFLSDATLITDKFITPSTDAAVYICSANWMTTAKKRKLYSVNFSVYANLFIVPKTDRDFLLKQSDLKFFTRIRTSSLQDVTEANVSTAFGNDTQYYLSGGYLGGSEVKLDTPAGINRESIPYPYIQSSIGLWGGTELAVKFSPKLTYKALNYEIYGLGIKHNISQYFKKMEAKNIYISQLISYSKEEATSNFIDVTTALGTLGLNKITGKVDTWQYQLSASKEWKKFELIGSVINNYSNFQYILTGPKGTIEEIYPVQSILNTKFESIYAKKWNVIFELSGRYKMQNFYLQASATFGKFVSTGLSAQYEFDFGKKVKNKEVKK